MKRLNLIKIKNLHASKDIIEMRKDVEKIYSLTEDGLKYANNGLPERKILDVLFLKSMKQVSGLQFDGAVTFVAHWQGC